jgi:hypothetical protein
MRVLHFVPGLQPQRGPVRQLHVALRAELREKRLMRAAGYSWEKAAAGYEDTYMEVHAELERPGEEVPACAA